MPRKPFGSICCITLRFEGEGDPPGAGDYLKTRAGSAYLIVEARPIRGDLRRLRLTCARFDPADIPEVMPVCILTWDSRKRSR